MSETPCTKSEGMRQTREGGACDTHHSLPFLGLRPWLHIFGFDAQSAEWIG